MRFVTLRPRRLSYCALQKAYLLRKALRCISYIFCWKNITLRDTTRNRVNLFGTKKYASVFSREASDCDR